MIWVLRHFIEYLQTNIAISFMGLVTTRNMGFYFHATQVVQYVMWEHKANKFIGLK